MEELKIVTLEGKEYTVLDEIESGNITYVYFINPDNLKDFCIRKLSHEKKEFLLGLDDKSEFEFALKLFEQKNNETFN